MASSVGSLLALDTVCRTRTHPRNAERHYNLSRHSELRSLKISLYCTGTNGLSWLIPIISLANTEHLQSLDVGFVPMSTHAGDDIEAFLQRLDDSPVLTQLDDTLQEARFTPFYLHMSIINSSQAVDEHIFGKGSVKGEWNRWDELVRRKMPQSDRRGVLRYVAEISFEVCAPNAMTVRASRVRLNGHRDRSSRATSSNGYYLSASGRSLWQYRDHCSEWGAIDGSTHRSGGAKVHCLGLLYTTCEYSIYAQYNFNPLGLIVDVSEVQPECTSGEQNAR